MFNFLSVQHQRESIRIQKCLHEDFLCSFVSVSESVRSSSTHYKPEQKLFEGADRESDQQLHKETFLFCLSEEKYSDGKCLEKDKVTRLEDIQTMEVWRKKRTMLASRSECFLLLVLIVLGLKVSRFVHKMKS